jgi:hypothetical protein
MGSFLVNLHVRTDDHEALACEVQGLPIGGCWVVPPQRGWATIYEERASSQDEQWIKELSAGISQRLQAPAIAFLVHDSDIFCYWLFDRGAALDEFNSCPDYFEAASAADRARCQGQADVLLPFCTPGTTALEIERVLRQKPVFADEQLMALLPFLGIAPERALVDYRDLGSELDPDEIGAVYLGTRPPASASTRTSAPSMLRLARGDEEQDGDADDEDEGDSIGLQRRSKMTAPDLAHWLGLPGSGEPPDPLVAELVQAASDGNVPEIERLVAAGADLAGLAPLKGPLQGPASLTSQMLSSGGLAIHLSSVHAAIASKQPQALKRLIELGADVTAKHPLFGTSVHAAVAAGAADLVQILLEAGVAVNEVNAQHQTPLATLRGMRQMMTQIGNLRSLGMELPANLQSRIDDLLPAQGWEECERLLLAKGGH